MAAGSSSPYRLIYTGVTREVLRSLARRARRRGVAPSFLHTLLAVESYLRDDPLNFGEPIYDLTQIGLQVRIASNPFLYVTFAVDETRRLVYVVKYVGAGPLAN